jgi:hypothetical protein
VRGGQGVRATLHARRGILGQVAHPSTELLFAISSRSCLAPRATESSWPRSPGNRGRFANRRYFRFQAFIQSCHEINNQGEFGCRSRHRRHVGRVGRRLPRRRYDKRSSVPEKLLGGVLRRSHAATAISRQMSDFNGTVRRRDGTQDAHRRLEIVLDKLKRMPQTIIIVAVIVIGLLFLAIGGCYFAQGRKRRQLADRTGPDDGQR